jgi:hypothetical protein
MGKRKRRERDKPKAAHDAAYNPNKRVLLSYASDGEDAVEQTTDAPCNRPVTMRRRTLSRMRTISRQSRNTRMNLQKVVNAIRP